MEGKTVVLLRTSSVARIPVYEHLKSQGLRMIIVHPFVNPAFEPLFEHWLEFDTHDVDALEPVLREKLEEWGVGVPDAILSFDEYAVYPASVLATRFNTRPTPLHPKSILKTSVKSDFRKFCDATPGLNAPRSAAIFSRDDDLDVVLENMEYPVVMKPSPGAGSLLAKMIFDRADAESHLKKMWDVLEGHPDTKHFLALHNPVHIVVEEYIGGQEVDIDCSIVDGEIAFAAVSDNFEVLPPFFVERGGCTPSRLDDSQQEALLDLLRAFCRAMGPELNGVLHFEAKYDFDRQRAYVIEINCRLGSAETNTMVTNVYGVQLGECLIRSGLGLPMTNLTADSSIPRKVCASVNIYPSAIGTLTKVAAPVEDPSLVKYSISQVPGAKVSPPPTTFYLLSWMVCEGSTSEEAIANIDRCTANFVQEIEPEVPVADNADDEKTIEDCCSQDCCSSPRVDSETNGPSLSSQTPTDTNPESPKQGRARKIMESVRAALSTRILRKKQQPRKRVTSKRQLCCCCLPQNGNPVEPAGQVCCTLCSPTQKAQ